MDGEFRLSIPDYLQENHRFCRQVSIFIPFGLLLCDSNPDGLLPRPVLRFNAKQVIEILSQKTGGAVTLSSCLSPERVLELLGTNDIAVMGADYHSCIFHGSKIFGYPSPRFDFEIQ